MISIGLAVEKLVPRAKYTGYFGNVETTPETYSALMAAWEDTRAIPTYDDLLSAASELETEKQVQEAEDQAARDAITNSQIYSVKIEDVENWIDNTLTSDWPDEQTMMDLIDAQSIPAQTKTILKKHVLATYRIISIQKKMSKLLRAIMRVIEVV